MVDRAIHKAWITSAFVEADESSIRRRVVHCVGIVIFGLRALGRLQHSMATLALESF